MLHYDLTEFRGYTLLWNEEVQKCPKQASAGMQMPLTQLRLQKNCLQQTEVLEHGHPTHLWQGATPIIVGWFVSHTWKNNVINE